jgi:hypothetical protein
MAAKEIPIAGYGPRLLSRVEVAEGTMAFYFEKPSQFDFKPGHEVRQQSPPE